MGVNHDGWLDIVQTHGIPTSPVAIGEDQNFSIDPTRVWVSDGVVDFADVMAVLGNWLTVCP